jgi:hypothetical protein
VLAAIDGFYGAVVQQLRPWRPKAPQLPPSGRTAAEAAGIDIEPPPSDLIEPEEPDTTAPPEAEEAPSAVIQAVEGLAPAAPVADGHGPPDEPDADDEEEFVSWDAAHQRIEHERDLDRS